MTQPYDILAIGNAIVDIVCRCDDNFLKTIGATKGKVCLVTSPDPIAAIYRRTKQGLAVAGGAAANTAVGMCSIGGRAAFVGSVADDDFGRTFQHDIRGIGVTFVTSSKPANGLGTSHALILVTPDGQRTIFTHIGCSSGIEREMIELPMIRSSKIILLEGYLCDQLSTNMALQRAISLAQASGRRVALTLSDVDCVKRNRNEFFDVIRAGVDIVIGNEKEFKALSQTRNLGEAVRLVSRHIPLLALTRSADGSILVSKGQVIEIPPEPVKKVVDATGAGDLYAAGFLYGLSRGMDLQRAGRLGSFAASEILGHFGARPEAQLGNLALMRGLMS